MHRTDAKSPSRGFLSTLSLRRATWLELFLYYQDNRFLSTLSLRRATAVTSVARVATTVQISIHALLAESDRLWTILYSCPGNFYPRSPCGERHLVDLVSIVTNKDFYPRSPCGERLIVKIRGSVRPDISIHALLAESDLSKRDIPLLVTMISIHALLAESDIHHKTRRQFASHFYPRSPCGERLLLVKVLVKSHNFYPRSPCGERLP